MGAKIGILSCNVFGFFFASRKSDFFPASIKYSCTYIVPVSFSALDRTHSRKHPQKNTQAYVTSFPRTISIQIIFICKLHLVINNIGDSFVLNRAICIAVPVGSVSFVFFNRYMGQSCCAVDDGDYHSLHVYSCQT